MAEKKSEKYIETVGRRKTAVARVRITPATKASVTVNGKALVDYFPTKTLQNTISEPITKTKIEQKFDITVVVKGSGASSQAQAIRHGVARGLVKYDENFRKALKSEGFLKRDPRMKERRKFGLKKARKAPQWSKR